MGSHDDTGADAATGSVSLSPHNPITPSPSVPWRSHWDDAFAEAKAARKPVLVYADGEG